MNFPNVPKRSSADDELDQVLNAWAESHSEFIEESPRGARFRSSTNALEFHRWADETLRSEPAAKGPAAGTWNRVLHHVEQKSPRGTAAMSATTVDAAGNAAIVYDPRPYNRKEMTLSRFANIAATVAIVFAVSVGGWFAMSQLPPGGDGRFAALQASPEVAESGTCDVEPLTVDEVMAIVENPYSAVDPSWWGTPAPGDDFPSEGPAYRLDEVDLSFVQVMWPPSTSQARYVVPEEQAFDDATPVAQEILDCMLHGTMGQMWALMEPASVQSAVLAPYAVYRDEATIRASVENAIEQPHGESFDSYMEVNSDLTFQPNPRRGDARVWITNSTEVLDYDKIMLIGWQGLDSNGEVVFTDDWEATTVEGDSSRTNGTSLILVHSESTGKWYFFGLHAPRG